MTVKELLAQADAIMAKPTRTRSAMELIMRAQVQLELDKMLAVNAGEAAKKLSAICSGHGAYDHVIIPATDGSTLVCVRHWIGELKREKTIPYGVDFSDLHMIRWVWDSAAPFRSAGYRIQFAFKNDRCTHEHEFNVNDFLVCQKICVRCGFVEPMA